MVRSENSSIVRQLILSGALLVLSTASNLWIGKHAQDVPDAIIIALFIIPLLPLAWWVYTHEKTLRSRQRILGIFRTRFMFSLLVFVVVGAIVGGSFAGVGYTLWHRTQKPTAKDLPAPKTKPPIPPSISSDKTPPEPSHVPPHGTRDKVRAADADKKPPPQTIIETGPVFGNIKERALKLADEIMDDLYMHGWMGGGPQKQQVFPYPSHTDANALMQWSQSRSAYFRFRFHSRVIGIRDEFAQLHIRSKELDDVLEVEKKTLQLFCPR